MNLDSCEICDVDWLAEILSLNIDQLKNDCYSGPIIIDCRPASAYHTIHIKTAYNLALPTLMMRRLTKGGFPVTSLFNYCKNSQINDDPSRWSSRVIVLYDNNSNLNTLASDVCQSLLCLVNTLKAENYRVLMLNGGLEKFRHNHPSMCQEQCAGSFDETLDTCCGRPGLPNLKIYDDVSSAKPSHLGAYALPVEVLPRLYLGDARNATDLDCLESRLIRYIINVTPNVPNKFQEDMRFKYLQIPINDHWSQSLTSYFPQAIRFIDEGLSKPTGVLIHCLAGISRSVTVTVAYLMHSKLMSLNDAYDFVKKCKPNIAPNLNFMGQLLELETMLNNGQPLDSILAAKPESSSCDSGISSAISQRNNHLTIDGESDVDSPAYYTPLTSFPPISSISLNSPPPNTFRYNPIS